MELVRTKFVDTQQDTMVAEAPEQVMSRIISDPTKYLRQTGLSLFEFMKVFWGEVSEDAFKPNWHIEFLCRELEQMAQLVGDNQPKKHDIIINIPPGTTKTLTCSIMFPVWCWTRWPWLRFITASYSGALALESAEKSRDLIRSDKFTKLYPNISLKEDKDAKGNYRIQTIEQGSKSVFQRKINGGNRFSTSVGGTLTGYHGHIIIIDDPLNPKQAASELELNKANTWMEQTLPTRKTDKRVTPTILVMQRLHENDPTGFLLEKKKAGIRHICLPGEIITYGQMVNPPELKENYIDDLLDPVRLDRIALAELETDLGQYGYAGQIGQKPTPPGGAMFKVDNIGIIDSFNPVDVVSWTRYWDKAGTAGGGAHTVGLKMGKFKNGTYIITDVRRGQWASATRENNIRNTAEIDGSKVHVGIEQEPGSGGKESAENTVRNLAGFFVYTEHPTGDKSFRADPFSVQVNHGNVFLLRGEWNKAYIDELRFFPYGKYKDQVDGSSGAFNYLVKRKIARRIT